MYKTGHTNKHKVINLKVAFQKNQAEFRKGEPHKVSIELKNHNKTNDTQENCRN